MGELSPNQPDLTEAASAWDDLGPPNTPDTTTADTAGSPDDSGDPLEALHNLFTGTPQDPASHPLGGDWPPLPPIDPDRPRGYPLPDHEGSVMRYRPSYTDE